MYLGNIVEIADYNKIYANPFHPYTQALINAIPMPDPKLKRKYALLEGDVPSPINPPAGCPFATRCPKATALCSAERPKLKQIGEGQQVACHLVES